MDEPGAVLERGVGAHHEAHSLAAVEDAAAPPTMPLTSSTPSPIWVLSWSLERIERFLSLLAPLM